MSLLRELEWLRPMWFWALLAVPLLPFELRRLAARGSAWTRAVDAHLLPHLLDSGTTRGSRTPAVLAVLASVLAIVALAGPSLRQQRAPLWQVRSPLVIAVDLSYAMRAADLKPTRAAQARYELAALLRERRGGQVGLLAYADGAYTVAPLTRDARTVAALVDQLDPDVMPDEGQRADRAIRRAQSLMKNAGFTAGEILLLTDRADAYAIAAARAANAAGFRVHVLGIGTAAGAPIAGARGFLTDEKGDVRFARLDAPSLMALAAAGGGRYAASTPDDADLRGLGVLNPQAQVQQASEAEQALLRSDDGYWLVLALLPLVLLGFRRNWLAVVPLALAGALLQIPATARAADAVSDSWSWDSLWRRDDQRAHDALVAGDAARAKRLAQDDATRGAADYRAGEYDDAARAWGGTPGADGHYNRGNALAQSGKLEDAIAAYDAALAQAPGMDDAVENRRIVEEQLKKQEQQQQQQGGQQQQQDQQKQQDQQQQQDGQQQDQQQQQQEGERDQQQSGDEQQQQRDGKDASGENADDEQQQEQQPQDAQAQQHADEAQKQAMEQALAEQGREGEPQQEQQQARVLTPEERAELEREQSVEQLLRRVPDDPGGLLRSKFRLEHQRRQAEGDDE